MKIKVILSGLAEKYVRIVQYYYVWWQYNSAAVRCAVGVAEGFEVKVELHQGLALSPCLFAMVMDRMMDDIREEYPWTMMFANDIVICSESKERVEEKPESWRYALERRGMKFNRRKTEYMCVNERQVNGTVKMHEKSIITWSSSISDTYLQACSTQMVIISNVRTALIIDHCTASSDDNWADRWPSFEPA